VCVRSAGRCGGGCEWTDFPRHVHAVADRRDRRKYRQPVQDRGRRHGPRARRARSRRRAHSRHQVRDREGTVIASAPKAEVGLSSASLLTGSPRAERLNLVGAELAIRVEATAGFRSRPAPPARARTKLTLASVGGATPVRAVEVPDASLNKRSMQESVAAFLAWLDSLGALGLDGGDLTRSASRAATWSSMTCAPDISRNSRTSTSASPAPIRGTRGRLGSEDAARPWLCRPRSGPTAAACER